jgi:secreted PhoX family phosphatase
MPGARDPHSHDRTPRVSERHGYVFEVDAHAEGLVDPAPIRAMGRFYHEAVAVDPATGYVYLSEDRDDGLLYRYRPDAAARSPRLSPGDLARGGVLEALRIAGRPSAATQNWGSREFVPGARFAVDWVRIPDVDPEIDQERDPDHAETDPLRKGPRTAAGSTRAQGFGLGAAQFARGEGMTYSKGAIYLCCTNGGAKRFGQVWRLEPGPQRLALAVEPDDLALLDGPDNLVVAPNGDLIVCEDGRDDDYLVGITRGGRFYRIARCVPRGTELAGACFSPDGRTLFVNIQNPGVTCAIQGPWGSRV